MKKVLFLIALIALAMASCVKSYSCECTRTDKATGAKETTSYPITSKKSTASSTCDALADGDMTDYSETCTLK